MNENKFFFVLFWHFCKKTTGASHRPVYRKKIGEKRQMLLSTTFNTSTCEPPRFLGQNEILPNYNVTNSKKIHNEPITVLIFVKLMCLQYKLTCQVWSWSMYTLSYPPYLQLYRPCNKGDISPPKCLFFHTNVYFTLAFVFTLQFAYKHHVILHLVTLVSLIVPVTSSTYALKTTYIHRVTYYIV